MIVNSLPTFASLTMDMGRELKAECVSPGTYFVIVTPDSFNNDDADRSQSKKGPLVSSKVQTTMDPNLVFLHCFEDTVLRSPAQCNETPLASFPLPQTTRDFLYMAATLGQNWNP